jgi:hypothetical protein
MQSPNKIEILINGVRNSQFLSAIPFAIRNSPFAVRHSPFAIRRSPFAVRHSPFAIRHSPFAIRRSPFAIRNYRPPLSSKPASYLRRASGQ